MRYFYGLKKHNSIEQYSVSDELALLRQKDTKQSEYEEYFNYVEEIKLKLKNGEF